MNVAIYRKNESLLSPDEARHVMPILDSAVTIGTIIASLCLLLLISSMSLVDLMFLWILPLFAIGFLVVHSKSIIRDIPRIELQKIKQSEKTHWIYALSFIGKTKFLSLMLVMVLFQSALWTTSDFVFTHWLQEHVPQQVAEPLMGNLQSNIFIDSVQQVGHIIEEVSSNMFVHESLVHYLGWFSLLFGIIALVVQLVLASKLLERLGVIGTMMSFFGSFGLMVFALITGQFNMNWVRGVQHGFHSFFEVGYHLTYYSIESPYREVVRHFFEAIIKPLGVIFCLGTVWVFSRLGFDAIAVSYYILLILALALVGLLYL
ncbi:MAG TPA: hypothetical protein VIT68_03965, partial [Candidatus Gracilibacteria bacterium]